MSDLRTAAQQALAFTMRDFASLRDFEAAKAVLHDNLRAALAQQEEPCPNCASLEAQNTELDRKLAQLERAHGIIESEIKEDSHQQTIDEAMRLPRALSQAYENGYKAGQVHERERIIQFLQEMQRVVGDAHNHYGVAAVRIKERI